MGRGTHFIPYSKRRCLAVCQRQETAVQLGAIIQAQGRVNGAATFLSW